MKLTSTFKYWLCLCICFATTQFSAAQFARYNFDTNLNDDIGGYNATAFGRAGSHC